MEVVGAMLWFRLELQLKVLQSHYQYLVQHLSNVLEWLQRHFLLLLKWRRINRWFWQKVFQTFKTSTISFLVYDIGVKHIILMLVYLSFHYSSILCNNSSWMVHHGGCTTLSISRTGPYCNKVCQFEGSRDVFFEFRKLLAMKVCIYACWIQM